MILHGKMWIWEYFACIKSNLFILLQICLALFLINNQTERIVWETGQLSSITDADSDTYLFQYALAACGVFDGNISYTDACGKIQSLPGIKGIGEIFNTSVSIVGDSEKYPDELFEINALDSIATSSVTYNIKEGRWLYESDRGGDVIHAILGGNITKRYKIGDIINIDLGNGETYEIEIVGELADHYNKLDLNGLSGNSSMDSFMVEGENDIFINHDSVLRKIKKNKLGVPSAHCIVKLDKDADKKFLSGYGKLVSFEDMMQETRETLNDFVKNTAIEGIIWTIIIIFGIIATTYLVGKKRRYVWGIYLMLGEKPKKLFKIHMANNSITYMIGTVASLFIYEIYSQNKDISSMSDISIYHIIIDAAFLLIITVMSLFTNLFILKMEPKEILTQSKRGYGYFRSKDCICQ